MGRCRSAAVAPEWLTPVGSSAEIHRVTCFREPMVRIMYSGCMRQRQRFRLTTIIAPTAAQPGSTLGIHDRSARLAHSRRRRSTRRKRRCRTIGRAIAEPNLAGVGSTVEILALDVVLWAAMAVRAAAAVIVAGQVGTRGHAGAGT